MDKAPIIAMLPRVLCVYWGFHSWWCSRQRGGLHGLLNLAISPERMPLTHGCHRPPPGHARSGDRSHDLSVVRPTLSPIELAGDPCVCVCVRALRFVLTRVHNIRNTAIQFFYF